MLHDPNQLTAATEGKQYISFFFYLLKVGNNFSLDCNLKCCCPFCMVVVILHLGSKKLEDNVWSTLMHLL